MSEWLINKEYLNSLDTINESVLWRCPAIANKIHKGLLKINSISYESSSEYGNRNTKKKTNIDRYKNKNESSRRSDLVAVTSWEFQSKG